jgi:hypothetical protein
MPFALGSFQNDVEQQGLNIIWEAIYRYFPSVRSRPSLGIADVNREENVITIYAPLHYEFGAFHQCGYRSMPVNAASQAESKIVNSARQEFLPMCSNVSQGISYMHLP